MSLVHFELLTGKRAYFASDFHLGASSYAESLEREKKICAWLSVIKSDAQVLFLMGDMFDFWYEYKKVIPKGFSRFFGKLAELHDAGVKLYIFKGNHDMWQKDYFELEFGAEIISDELELKINNTTFYLAHGDGLGPGDYGYKRLKKVFRSKLNSWIFGNLLHPNFSQFLGQSWANHSWHKHKQKNDVYNFESKESEILYHFCEEIEKAKAHDFYVFGHRHYKLDIALSTGARYINLGDWIKWYSFAEFDGQKMELKEFIA